MERPSHDYGLSRQRVYDGIYPSLAQSGGGSPRPRLCRRCVAARPSGPRSPLSRVTVPLRSRGVSAAYHLHNICVTGVRRGRGADLCARAYLPGCVSELEPPLP